MPHLKQSISSQSQRWMLVCLLALAVAALTAAAGSAAQGDVDLISRAGGAAGSKANAGSDTPAIAADGRFVAFHSVATNLDAADGDATGDVYVRDALTNTTRLVSRASGADGAKGNGNSFDATISGDGRFVAFESSSTNLGGGVATPSDVYVRDLQANTTTQVDRASGANGAPADGLSGNAAISGNGRFVVFTSLASNLSTDDGDLIEDVFVRDLQTNTTTLVSRASGAAGAAANQDSSAAEISADGRFVTFTSFASNLDPADPSADGDVFVRDLQTSTTTLVSRASGANGAKSNGFSDDPAISGDGRFVAFFSLATNLSPDDGDIAPDIYVRDLQTNTTTLVDRADVIAGQSDIYVRDLQQNTTTLVSRARGAAGANADGARPAISADGRFVAFDSTPST